MPYGIAEKFRAALRGVEDYGDPSVIANLYTEDAELISPRMPLSKGPAGAMDFWTRYVSAFREIHTDFVKTFRHGNAVVLEWVSNGILRSGKSFCYEGATLLELKDDKIGRMRVFYDEAGFKTMMTGRKAEPKPPAEERTAS